MKTHLKHGIIAGILASLGGVIYLQVYQNLFFLDYSLVINAVAIIASCMIGCLMMAAAYMVLDKLNKARFQGILNVAFVIISFASIIPPMTMSLPLEVEFPELFPGLVIPMHFFPALAFTSILPFFQKKTIVQ